MHRDKLPIVFPPDIQKLLIPVGVSSLLSAVVMFCGKLNTKSLKRCVGGSLVHVLSQSRDAAISPIPVKAIEPLDPHSRIVTKIGPNAASFPGGGGRRGWHARWGRNHHPRRR